MSYFIAQITDTVVLAEDPDDYGVLEFKTYEEAEEWARDNCSYNYFILATYGAGSVMSGTLALDGCGNNELLLQSPKWMSDTVKIAVYICCDDYEELQHYSDEFKFQEGDKPIKMTAYLIVDPSEVHPSQYGYDHEMSQPQIAEEINSQTGHTHLLTALNLEFNTLKEAERYIYDIETEHFLNRLIDSTDLNEEAPEIFGACEEV